MVCLVNRPTKPMTATIPTDFSHEEMFALWDRMSDDLSDFAGDLGLEDEKDSDAAELSHDEMVSMGLTSKEASILVWALSESARGTIKTAEQVLYWATKGAQPPSGVLALANADAIHGKKKATP